MQQKGLHAHPSALLDKHLQLLSCHFLFLPCQNSMAGTHTCIRKLILLPEHLEEPSPHACLSQTSHSNGSVAFYEPAMSLGNFILVLLHWREIIEEGIYLFLAMGRWRSRYHLYMTQASKYFNLKNFSFHTLQDIPDPDVLAKCWNTLKCRLCNVLFLGLSVLQRHGDKTLKLNGEI